MMGLGGNRPDGDPLGRFTSRRRRDNCEQTYHRYLRPR